MGVFDSGFGGLTVLRQLLPLLPGTRSIYLGDTARLPYGSKSRETISRYALSSAHFLVEQGADLLVVACNTATALALDDLQRELPIPVIGVIEPGAQAALDALPRCQRAGARDRRHRAIARLPARAPGPGLRAYEMACPLLVPLVEEGWTDHPVTDEVLRIYLDQALTAAPDTNTLLLGCTHYPLLEPALRRALDKLGHPLTIIDSAHATARPRRRWSPSTSLPASPPRPPSACTGPAPVQPAPRSTPPTRSRSFSASAPTSSAGPSPRYISSTSAAERQGSGIRDQQGRYTSCPTQNHGCPIHRASRGPRRALLDGVTERWVGKMMAAPPPATGPISRSETPLPVPSPSDP